MGQPSLAIHDFNEQLNYSVKASEETFWDAIYKKAFPDLINHMPCNGDTKSQRLGVDRVLHMASGKTIYIDEKKRKEAWDDILLEYLSNDKTNAPGWIEKDLQIDYLAYAFMPTERVYLLNWLMLKRAWLVFKDSWMDKYKRIPAENKGYTTWSVAVPIGVLLRAVKNASIIQVNDLPHTQSDSTEY